MKLWILEAIYSRGGGPWQDPYDKAFGFVVRAETEMDARRLANANSGMENREPGDCVWMDSKHSTCDELLPGGDAGVLIRDFNKG